MKKIKALMIMIAFIMSVSGLNAAESNFDVKLGATGPKDAEQVGFDAAVSLNLGINDFFAIGLEPGLTWITWDKATGATQTTPGGGTADVVNTFNAFIIPTLVNARIRFPVYLSDQKSTFFIALGAGYTYASYQFKSPEYTDSSDTLIPATSARDTFTGFTWQAMTGIAIAMGDNFSVIVEGGYRGSPLKNDTSAKLDMSGWVAHVGARFSFGGSDW